MYVFVKDFWRLILLSKVLKCNITMLICFFKWFSVNVHKEFYVALYAKILNFSVVAILVILNEQCYMGKNIVVSKNRGLIKEKGNSGKQTTFLSHL